MVFLAVYTPTYRRPTLLATCKGSVAGQLTPVQHVIVEDTVGLGIGGMYAAIADHAGAVRGEYVMVLSDDDALAGGMFAYDLEVEAIERDYPDVILFRGQIGACLQPLSWGGEPQLERINLSCFAVKRGVWLSHAGCWGRRYEGDYDYIWHLWRLGYRLHWWDRLGFRAQRGPMRGAPE